MKIPNREEQRRLVKQWDETGPEFARNRREALRGMPYRWQDVDALLELGEQSACPSRYSSGIVEMQYWFMKSASHPSRPKESDDVAESERQAEL